MQYSKTASMTKIWNKDNLYKHLFLLDLHFNRFLWVLCGYWWLLPYGSHMVISLREVPFSSNQLHNICWNCYCEKAHFNSWNISYQLNDFRIFFRYTVNVQLNDTYKRFWQFKIFSSESMPWFNASEIIFDLPKVNMLYFSWQLNGPCILCET